jgi:predicted AAA+ superfamily ATPase
MQPISDDDIRVRIGRDNHWWQPDQTQIPEAAWPRRIYFQSFKNLALNFGIRRATVLLGPRRVGKTFMIKQLIHEAMASGVSPKNILYVSVDTPIYLGISLEQFISFMPTTTHKDQAVVIFDEIQYLANWEIHLKDLVDNHPNVKFIASGSAAAALQLKSKESGAGRFSDFMLPPLTFYEFLSFLQEGEKYIRPCSKAKNPYTSFEITDIDGLNSRFVDYLNYGGYPEAVLNEQIRKNPEQFIKNDIIDKVLLKDLPSLYGITGIQELNKLFSFLAYNAGNEASFENISQESGTAKPTIKRYIEYLESAFLLIKVSTVDDNCKTMKRERNFKIYLNNPSMRAALFAPVKETDSQKIGQLAECAIFSQWQHSSGFSNLRYARWRNEGEVDIVYLSPGKQKPLWIGEIKWSDRVRSHRDEEMRGLTTLLRRHPSIAQAFLTSRTIEDDFEVEGRRVFVIPSSAYCYVVGRNIASSLERPVALTADEPPQQQKQLEIEMPKQA